MIKSFKRDRRSDKQLVEVCNGGGREEAIAAFEALYRRHRDFVLRVALRFTHDHELALDALQETFSYLLKKFPPPGDGLTLTAQLTTYLYPVVRNFAISSVRKAVRYPPSDVEPDDLPAKQHPAAESDIPALLRELSPDRREVIQLRFVDDMSLRDIAVALDIPIGTVKSRLHLAIKQLRNSHLEKIVKSVNLLSIPCA